MVSNEHPEYNTRHRNSEKNAARDPESEVAHQGLQNNEVATDHPSMAAFPTGPGSSRSDGLKDSGRSGPVQRGGGPPGCEGPSFGIMHHEPADLGEEGVAVWTGAFRATGIFAT